MYHRDTKQLQENLQLELLGDSGVWMTKRAQILLNDGRPKEASALRQEFSRGPALGTGGNR
tara:strand:+ start:417 stop:599 length:183 start_codon:yes stop_codon:yes gene_type:complete